MPKFVQSNSSNTNKPHSSSFVFPEQSHSDLGAHPQTSGGVSSSSGSSIKPVAGPPRLLPLAVASDNSRDPARQPAAPIVEWPDHPRHNDLHVNGKQGSVLHTAPMHIRHVKRGSEREIFAHISSRTGSYSTSAGTQPHASGRTSSGGAPQYPDNTQTSQGKMERPPRGVWQDNDRISRDREASAQPSADNKITRSQATNNQVVRLQKSFADNRRTVPVQVWVHPLIKEELSRIARAEGLSLSAAGGALLERALQQNVDMRYGALLNPVIEQAITKQMRGISTRLAWLLVRVSIDSGQTRSLVTNILGHQPGMTTDLLRSIVKQSADTARGNITRRTPQLEDVIQSIEEWLMTDEEADRGQRN